MNKMPRYLILGRGRAARHLGQTLRLSQAEVHLWETSPRLIANSLDSTLLQKALLQSTHVLLLVSDSAIEPLALYCKKELESLQKTLPSTSRYWIHASGALTTPHAWGCHPLMTFSSETIYSAETYSSMSFVLEDQAPAWSMLFPTLKNPHYRIPTEKKALYHALCVLSGNFSMLLWKKLFAELEDQFKIPRSAAIPYLETVFQNLKSHPESALTGPLARKDHSTLRKNLEALQGDPYQGVYQAFVNAFMKEKI